MPDPDPELFILMKQYKDEKSRVLDQLRDLGVPESMLKARTLEQLKELVDRYV